MIWGKTYIEKGDIKRKKALRWFAWYPVHLKDGRWCWLDYVKYDYWASWGSSGSDYEKFNPKNI